MNSIGTTAAHFLKKISVKQVVALVIVFVISLIGINFYYAVNRPMDRLASISSTQVNYSSISAELKKNKNIDGTYSIPIIAAKRQSIFTFAMKTRTTRDDFCVYSSASAIQVEYPMRPEIEGINGEDSGLTRYILCNKNIDRDSDYWSLAPNGKWVKGELKK